MNFYPCTLLINNHIRDTCNNILRLERGVITICVDFKIKKYLNLKKLIKSRIHSLSFSKIRFKINELNMVIGESLMIQLFPLFNCLKKINKCSFLLNNANLYFIFNLKLRASKNHWIIFKIYVVYLLLNE